MKKNLYFFTSSYPYSHDFAWKTNELNVLSKKYDNITIIPFTYNYKKVAVQLPENISVIKPIIKKSYFIKWYSVNLLFNPRFFYYLNEFFSKKVYKEKKHLISWFLAINRTEELRKNQFIKNLLNREHKNTTLYFYWGIGNTLIIPFLKKTSFSKIVVRFHGFDLYEDINNGYIPFRRQMLKNITTALPIANDGKEHLLETNPGIHFNTKIFRLGTFHKGLSKSSSDGILRIFSASHVIAFKRVELILQAVKRLKFTIIWTHLGDGELLEGIKQQVDELPENIKVVFPGWIKAENVLDYYVEKPVDLFLNVSTSEGVPVSIMEAFSAGIPVIATNVGGTSEIVNEQNGLLLPIDLSVKYLSKEIERFFYLSFNEKEKKRKVAYATYRKLCDFEKNTDKLIKFLQSPE